MPYFRLPVSGIDVVLRQPAGVEDLFLLETDADDSYLALALLSRVARVANAMAAESGVDWQDLPVTDLDVLMLRLRQLVFGNYIQAETNCPVAGCAARIDASIQIDEYLDHHRPRRVRNAELSDESGWFRLRSAPVLFRLPTVADQLAVAGRARPVQALIQRCIRPADVAPRLVRRVETAMDALAPSLAHELEGVCPECGTTVNVYFDPRQFTLQELRGQAAFIMQDVHLLAAYYHWPESHILALPRSRRLHYAEMVRQERSLV